MTLRELRQQLRVARDRHYLFHETLINLVRIVAGKEPEIYVHNKLTDSFTIGMDNERKNYLVNSSFSEGLMERLTCG